MTDEALPDRARRARKAAGKTQEEIAEAADVSLRTYQNFESGRSFPQGANLRAILRALGLDETQRAHAEATRDEWPLDVRVFLDMIGAFLATMTEEERLRFIHDETRRIFVSR